MKTRSTWVKRTQSLGALLLVSAAFVLQRADVALAGPVELLNQVALHPTDPEMMVLRYTNGGDGFVYSRDGGETWRLLCRSAISTDIKAGPIAVTGDGHVMMGVIQGLWIDDAKGCAWAPSDDFGDRWAPAFALDPRDPETTFIATAKNSPGVKNGVVKRDAEGELTDFGITEELIVAQVKVVEREEGLRFYERVLRGSEFLLRYSDDDRETFTEFPFTSTEGNLGLAAVDPSNPDRIVALLDRPAETSKDDLLVSDDGGKTLRPYMTMSQFGAIQFLPSGKVYLGEAGVSTQADLTRGLWVADSLDEEPVKLADYPVDCLAYQASTDTLFACQYRSFGKVDQESGDFSELFNFTTTVGLVECGDDEDVAAACEDQLCADYCGMAHFAHAPVCDGYTKPGKICGPCAAMVDDGADPQMCFNNGGTGGSGGSTAGTTGGQAGTTATAGTKADAGTPPRAGSSGSDGGAGDDDGDDKGDGDKDDDDGCSCSSVGGTRSGAAAPLALSLLLGVAFTLRRRRLRI